MYVGVYDVHYVCVLPCNVYKPKWLYTLFDLRDEHANQQLTSGVCLDKFLIPLKW